VFVCFLLGDSQLFKSLDRYDYDSIPENLPQNSDDLKDSFLEDTKQSKTIPPIDNANIGYHDESLLTTKKLEVQTKITLKQPLNLDKNKDENKKENNNSNSWKVFLVLLVLGNLKFF